jgi:hypothetical protein
VAARALLVLGCGLVAACSGGSSDSDGSGGGSGSSSFRLLSCSIGCTDGQGCGGGSIGINQPMVFEFNQPVAARTVSPRSVNIVALTGEAPEGLLVAEGRRVTFQPRVRFANGVTTFGYRANTDYLVTIAAGGLDPLQSQSGERLGAAFSCTVRVRAEVVDTDGEPPRLVTIAPTPNSQIVSRPTVVIEFSELLDFAPFFDPGVTSPPVEFRVGASGADPDGTFTCSDTVLLPGAPVLSNDEARGVTLLRFQPQDAIPEDSCLSIVITDQVRDLAGTRALRQTVPPMFVGRPGIPRTLIVTFDDDRQLDRPRSNGDWANGEATFGSVGGDGRHGDFDPTDGTLTTPNTYRWSTDSQVLSAKDTITIGAGPVTVTDGRFFFSRFVLPAGVTLDFVGSNPVQILVRGECRIDGRIRCNGLDVADNFNGIVISQPPPAIPPGQPGGAGGPGGGDGGTGASRGNGQGPQAIFDGADGEDLTVPGSSFWSSSAALAATGGRGSDQFPAHGLNSQIAWYNAFTINYSLETGKGGGGGGYVQAGTPGSIVAVASVGLMTNNIADGRPDSGAGGLLFDAVLTQPRPTGVSSLDYYLVGGAGGGGGGSHAAFARQLAADPNPYRAGAGGGGGGGALAVRAGNGLTIGAGAFLEARGGRGPSTGSANTLFTNGTPLPGGGGSGGSVLLQAEGGFTQLGTVDVRGGAAGFCEVIGFYAMNVRAGAGAPGLARMEAVGGAPTVTGNVLPNPASVGELLRDDFDAVTGFMSLLVPMFLDQPPRFRRYEIDALVDGVPVLFTDDPEIPGGQPALAGISPLLFFAQSYETDAVTGQQKPGTTPGPWRRYVGPFGAATGEGSLVNDGGNGFRFIMLIDRTFAQNVVVQELRIAYRT